MNIPMAIKNRVGSSFHTLATEIREQFLGPKQAETEVADLRVVLYSHDTMGIGHMRRNLLIANQIKRAFPRSSILAVAGAKEATIFAQNAGVDCLTLPSYLKKEDGTYTTRNLGISADDVLDVRSQTILAAVRSYRPNLLIVDKVPAGAGGELLPTLDWISSNTPCHCVLGLRDILDSPDSVRSDWLRTRSDDVIRRHYNAVWIYGDPNVYNAVEEYDFPKDIADRVSFTGYLATESRLKHLGQLPYEIHVPYVLCTVGGGQDGEELSRQFIEAIRQTRHNAVLLTGPHMPPATQALIRELAESVPGLKVVEFVDEGDLLVKHASHVVSMGGYNTISAILSHHRPALIVPRVRPRQEQLLRANRLAELGLIQTEHPDTLTPETIANWLCNTPQSTCRPISPLRMEGLDRICEMIRDAFPECCSHVSQELNHAESNGFHK